MEALENAPTGPRLRRIRLRPVERNSVIHADEEPMTPAGQLFCHPLFSVHIQVICGLKTPCHVENFKKGLSSTLLTHKRFCSVVRENGRGGLYWVRTEVNLDDHIVIPTLTEEEKKLPDFVEQYMAKLSGAPPLDMSRPLFEFHILRAKLGDAVENVIFRVHHSLGDGISLMSLLLACTRQIDDPNLLPSIPGVAKRIDDKIKPSFPLSMGTFLVLFWRFLTMLWFTLFDVYCFIATMSWMSDTKTPILGSSGVENSAKIFTYRTVSLEDVRFVKKAVKGTVNDVLFGMLAAGLSSYLEHLCGEEEQLLAKDGILMAAGAQDAQRIHENGVHRCIGHIERLRIRASALINTRRSPGLHEIQDMMNGGSQSRWGNEMGYTLIPVPLCRSKNPLDHLYRAKKILDKKKLSLEALFSYRSGALLMKLSGTEVPAKLTYRCCLHTTLSFSNVVGPMEEIQFFGHPITHFLPTAVGQPQSLCVHIQSYMGKINIIAMSARDKIPDPGKLCNYMVDALKEMKRRIIEERF